MAHLCSKPTPWMRAAFQTEPGVGNVDALIALGKSLRRKL
jgi:hypothetical protein